MCQTAGIQVKSIQGFAKGPDWKPGIERELIVLMMKCAFVVFVFLKQLYTNNKVKMLFVCIMKQSKHYQH